MLTPEQFNILATKDDLEDLRSDMISKEEYKEGLDIILTAVDGLTKLVKDFQAELASNQAAHDRMDTEIITLKTRVTTPETI